MINKFQATSLKSWPDRTQNFGNNIRKPNFERAYLAKTSPRQRRITGKSTVATSDPPTSPIKCEMRTRNLDRENFQKQSFVEHCPKLHLHRKPQTTLQRERVSANVKRVPKYFVRPIEYEKIAAELLSLIEHLKQQRDDMRQNYHKVHQLLKLSECARRKSTVEQEQLFVQQQLAAKMLQVLSDLNQHINIVRKKYHDAIANAKVATSCLTLLKKQEARGLVDLNTIQIMQNDSAEPGANRSVIVNTFQRNKLEQDKRKQFIKKQQDNLDNLYFRINYENGNISGSWKDQQKIRPKRAETMKHASKVRPHQMVSYIMQSEKNVFSKKAKTFQRKGYESGQQEEKRKAFFPTKSRPYTPIARSY